jgi:hypothetical protein
MPYDRDYERALEAEEGKVHVEITANADGHPAAIVKWGPWVSDGIVRHGSAEGPMSVPLALRRADEVAALYGLKGVAIDLADERLWRPDWGVLPPKPADVDKGIDTADEAVKRDIPTRQWI